MISIQHLLLRPNPVTIAFNGYRMVKNIKERD
jgi:hypothetical protein